MGSKIYWRPKIIGTDLETGSPNSFWDNLGNSLHKQHDDQITVTAEQEPVIAAMVRVFPGDPAWERLLKAVQTHGTIIVERRW